MEFRTDRSGRTAREGHLRSVAGRVEGCANVAGLAGRLTQGA